VNFDYRFGIDVSFNSHCRQNMNSVVTMLLDFELEADTIAAASALLSAASILMISDTLSPDTGITEEQYDYLLEYAVRKLYEGRPDAEKISTLRRRRAHSCRM